MIFLKNYDIIIIESEERKIKIMTITVRITVTEEEYLEVKKEFEEVNDFEYTKEMFMEDQLDHFYADCREYIVDFADVDIEMA